MNKIESQILNSLSKDGTFTIGKKTYFYSDMLKNKKNYFMQIPKIEKNDVRLYDIKCFNLDLMHLEDQGYLLIIDDKKPLRVMLQRYVIENNPFDRDYPSRFDTAVQNGIISLKNLLENKYFHDGNNHFFTRHFENCSLIVWVYKYNEDVELPTFAVNYILVTKYFNLILRKQDVKNLFFFDEEIVNVVHEINKPPYSRSKLMKLLLDKDAKYFLKPLEKYKTISAFYKSVEDMKIVVYKDHNFMKNSVFGDYVASKKSILPFEVIKKECKKFDNFLECKLDDTGVILSYATEGDDHEIFIYKKTKYGLMHLEPFSDLYHKYQEDAEKLKKHREKRLELQRILNSK